MAKRYYFNEIPTHIDLYFISKHVSASVYEHATMPFEIELIEANSSSWKFRVMEYNLFTSKPEIEEPVFEIKHNGFMASCSCSSSSKKLCKHQAAVLIHLEHMQPAFFYRMNETKNKVIPEDVYEQIATTFGISKAEGKRFFDISEDHFGNVNLELKNEYEGMLFPNNIQKIEEDFRLNHLSREEKFVSKMAVQFKEVIIFNIELIRDDHYGISLEYGKARLKKNRSTGYTKPQLISDVEWESASRLSKDVMILLKSLWKKEEPYQNYFSYEEVISELKFKYDVLVQLISHANILNETCLIYLDFKSINRYSRKSIPGRYIKLSDVLFTKKLIVQQKKEFYYFKNAYNIGGESIASLDMDLLPINTYMLLVDNILHMSIKKLDEKMEDPIDQFEGVKVLKNQMSRLYNGYFNDVGICDDVVFSRTGTKKKEVKLIPKSQSLYLEQKEDFIIFKPLVTYQYKKETKEYNLLDKRATRVLEENVLKTYIRNQEWELPFKEKLKTLLPSFVEQEGEGYLYVSFNDFVQNAWFLSMTELLKEAGVEVYGFKKLKNFNFSSLRPKMTASIASQTDWFDIDVDVEIGAENFNLKSLQKRLVKGSNYVKLSDGKLGILPEEWVKKLEKYFRAGQVSKTGELKISKQRFNIIDELFDAEIIPETLQLELDDKRKKLEGFKEVKTVSVPISINAELRSYQKEGLNWLSFLHDFQWGGILADDMGLGKTLQILTFICYVQEQKKDCLPFLVVVPTTLLFNWENEIKKFCSELTYTLYHGVDRGELEEVYASSDVIITSYGVLSNEIECLKELCFEYVILDESQAIKNPSSMRYKSTMLLQANNKIAMTGTPIENNTFDLYAQMNFVNPMFFGSLSRFKNDYSNPIDKDKNMEVATELQRMINPFLLRRTKEKVAKELPDKIENILYCNMGNKQRSVYEAYKQKIKGQLLETVEANGINNSKLQVLQALTKMRQLCNSTALLNDDEDYGNESVKLEELLKHIKEKTGNHKILVFSQFTKMLALVKEKLDGESIIYEYLDGKSTKKQRERSVNIFQTDNSVRVFLISLKAGGVGLNLTAADYVYIVDPWWNPAIENQAIDRCYRIGQTKKVIAYRMICKDTIEEKILSYKSDKQKVADSIISTDDAIMKNIGKKDLESLFS